MSLTGHRTVELYLVDRFGDPGHFIDHLLKAIFYTSETLLCTAICAMNLIIAVAKPLYVLRTWGFGAQRLSGAMLFRRPSWLQSLSSSLKRLYV